MGVRFGLRAKLTYLEMIFILKHISDQVIFQVDAFESFLVKLDWLLFRS